MDIRYFCRMFTVTVPVKPYVKHYLTSRYGNPVELPRKTMIRNLFLATLYKEFPNFQKERIKRQSCHVQIKLSREEAAIHGHELNPALGHHISSIFEEKIKMEMFFEVRSLVQEAKLPVREAIQSWRQSHGYDEESFSFEAIRCAYYDKLNESILVRKEILTTTAT